MIPFNAALIVVDVQQGFLESSWGPRNNPDAETNVATLIGAWRRTGRPIHHVRHSSRSPSGSFYPGTAGHDFMPEAVPLAGERTYVKSVNSGFIGTTLELDLRAAGIDSLTVVGLTTNHCVSTTVRMAANLGFDTSVVEDATATFDRMALDGRMRPAAEVHAAALSDLLDEFAAITRTADIVRKLGIAQLGTP
ncbi:cysteine hydrolase family protein [Polymorphobacter megasporae]|uniref:cysteine hydrolase family protein n=1 Tax=Glacieibacterium megasporae TaxID=2835787 RepID=UPI001C1DDE17|nr:cysteine hydrolase family protein [Polymorphobacter megasporae]UAJ10617.1 cysteine hydrolase [Polymorphobacter megasporae]